MCVLELFLCFLVLGFSLFVAVSCLRIIWSANGDLGKLSLFCIGCNSSDDSDTWSRMEYNCCYHIFTHFRIQFQCDDVFLFYTEIVRYLDNIKQLVGYGEMNIFPVNLVDFGFASYNTVFHVNFNNLFSMFINIIKDPCSVCEKRPLLQILVWTENTNVGWIVVIGGSQ